MTQPVPRTAKSFSPRAKLRILGTTDLHGNLRGFDYHRGTPNPDVGLTRVASLIRQARAEAANSLLFDNGDTIQGTLLADRAVTSGNGTAPHPMIDALNWLGVDAATIGNHEFNFGIPALRNAYQAADFPVVCANVLTRRGAQPSNDDTLFPAWRMLERRITDEGGAQHQIKIAVTGVLPPQIMNWDYKHLSGQVTVRGIIETVAARISEMRAAGADVTVVLCHSGLGSDTAPQGAENAALAVAALPGVDAVIAGHSHGLYPSGDGGLSASPGQVTDTPLVLPGYHGSHLGVIDLDLVKSSSAWRIERSQASLRPCPETAGASDPVPEDPALVARVDPAHQHTLAHVAEPVGYSSTRLHTYFAILEPGPAQSLIATAQSRAMETLLRGTEYETLPVLSAVSPFKCGGRGGPEHFTDVAAGPVSVRHVSDLYLYPNSLRGLLVDGRMLRNWLERSAGAFCQVAPNQPAQQLSNPALPSYDFDTLFGVTYAYDLTQPSRYDPATGQLSCPSAARVTDLRWSGRLVKDEDVFIAATNNYRAGGGGNFPDIGVEAVVIETPQNVRDLLTDFLRNGETAPADVPTWRFKPVPKASVLVETCPRARTAQTDIERLGLRDAGDRNDGFAIFEYDLSDP